MIKELTKGDSATWVVPPFKAADGSSMDAESTKLAVFLVGPVKRSFFAAAEADSWRVTLDAKTSSELEAGLYEVSYRFTREGFQQTTRIGCLKVLPSIDEIESGHDVRTLAEKALEEAEKALASYNEKGQRVQSYTINGRSMTFSSATEILDIVRYWRRRVQAEKNGGRSSIMWVSF